MARDHSMSCQQRLAEKHTKKREYTKLFWRTYPLVSSDSVLITRNVKCTCNCSKFSATSPHCTLVKGNSPQHQFHYCCTKGCFHLFPSLPLKLLCSCPAFRIIVCIQFRLGYQTRAFLVTARRFDRYLQTLLIWLTLVLFLGYLTMMHWPRNL